MDRRPTLEARPPILIDAVVRTSIPYACREHVLGDLWERYRSPLRFIVDAARTVPFVIASQIRRTSTVSAVLIQAFLLSVGFLAGSGRPRAAAAPIVCGLVALVLRDAYKHAISISAKQVAADVLAGAGGVLLSQAIIAVMMPDLLLPRFALMAGLAPLVLLFCLRLQNPRLGAIPGRAMTQAPATLDALVTEVRSFERIGRRARLIEAGAGVAVALFFVGPLMSSTNWVLRIGFGLASAYGLHIARCMFQYRVQPMPDGLGFQGSLVYYRTELQRQHGHVRTMWRWYLLPFVPALLFILVGAAQQASGRGRPIWPALIVAAIVLGVGLIAHNGSQDMARKLRVRIDALSSVEER
jgi:hypothetical protein